MQFCYVHSAEVPEQCLVGAFLRMYADAGVRTLAVGDQSAAAKRCMDFLSVDTVPLPFVVEINKERTVLLGENCTQWVVDLIKHAQVQMPADTLAEFCRTCISRTLAPTTAALLQCTTTQQAATTAEGSCVSVTPTRLTRNSGSRISVNEAMQLGRDREAITGARQGATTR